MPARVSGKLTRFRYLLALGAASILSAATPDLAQARKLYSYTNYDASLKILLPLPAKDGAAYLLIGQNYYGLGDLKKATEALEKAIAAEPGNSEYLPLAGPRLSAGAPRPPARSPRPDYASKARQNFEKAVELDPQESGSLQRPVRILSGSAGLSGRRHGQGRENGRTHRRAE